MNHPKQSSSVIQGILKTALDRQKTGRLDDAERLYREILKIDGRHADALHLLGMIEYQRGNHAGAATRIREALAIRGDRAAYHSNLGTVLQAQGDLDGAANCFERALALDPKLAEIHTNLGNIFQARGDLNKAVSSFEHAIALNASLAEAHNNLGNALQSLDRLEDAMACYQRALAINPRYSQAYHNWGCVLCASGKVREGLAQYGKALELRSDYGQARFSVSLAQLSLGDFQNGWLNYESRRESVDNRTPQRVYRQPVWTGEKLDGGRVLIWGEQGVGDEIMFAGLVPDALRAGNRILLDCESRLRPLFARSFSGVDVVSGDVSPDRPGMDFNAHLPSGSLARLFRRTKADFRATTSPYLFADPQERERFRLRYADGRRLVGLTWYTKNSKTGRQRSIDLSLLKPLLSRSDIRWISLQYGNFDALESQAKEAGADILFDRTVDQLSNMDAFAAQTAAMDLVLTIDNSTAHLAGALGVPVWVMLPFAADWRWQLGRPDSPWYPTMRLFRQTRMGEWRSVIDAISSAIL